MKVLVAVASKHGSTHEIAKAITEGLCSQAIDTDLRNVAEIDGVDGYDAIVFGSAIYAGSWLPEARTFAERHQAEFAKLPVWLFSSGPLGTDDPQPHDDLARLAAPLGDVAVRDHHVFVGKLEQAGLGLAEQVITKVVKAPAGDFRNWDDVRGWARQIAAELQQAVQPVEA